MEPLELEGRVLDIVKRVRAGRRLEDDRVELKAEWPADVVKAARQLAAHANASGGEWVLWIIGLDESRGVVTVAEDDLAEWWPRVKAEFESIAPRLLEHLVVPISGDQVVALLFDVTRRPYLVRNPEGGRIQFEVPWREGVSTRTAKREDLVGLLYGYVPPLDVEILAGEISFFPDRQRGIGTAAHVEIRVYVAPSTDDAVTIPFHRCTGELLFNGKKTPALEIRAFPPSRWLGHGQREPDSVTVVSTSHEIVIGGAGRVTVNGRFEADEPAEIAGTIEARFTLRPIGARAPLLVSRTFRKERRPPPENLKWVDAGVAE
ncbi:MAG: hypothetical protein R3344_03840 [Acidobacteriota bacterium]|nr:hypothetical protein [Acidobacteriota bacterium]